MGLFSRSVLHAGTWVGVCCVCILVPDWASATGCGETFSDAFRQRARQERTREDRAFPMLDPAKRSGFQFDEVAIVQERHTLSELVNPNPAENLAVLHPSLVMDAFQRIHAWIRTVPKEQVVNPRYRREMMDFYPLFSRSMDVNNGRYIVGQYNAIKAFVDTIRGGASGDRGARAKTLMFVGPAGTGKTEFLDILTNVGKNLSATDPNHYYMTFEWVRLEKIPELVEYFNKIGETTKPFRNPISQSPIALLPKNMQEAVIGLARDRAREVCGFDPTPVRELDPQSAKIRTAILNHFKENNPGVELTPQKVVEVLNEFVVIRRHVFGMRGNDARVGYQGRDVNYDALTFSRNPYVYTENGPADAFSYFLNGKILSANGALLFLDEFYRQEGHLRDFFLDVEESKVVRREGAPAVPIDVAVVGAANYESIKKVEEKGGSKAQFSRTRFVPMLRDTHPVLITETLLLMKGVENLRVRRLVDPKQMEEVEGRMPLEEVPLSELFRPALSKGEFPEGPAGRYALWFNMGPSERPVLIAPHALELMAYTIAASRMVTDAAKAEKLGKANRIFNSTVFQDPIARLKVLIGERELNPGQRRELEEVSRFLKEGDLGIDQRDAANIWLTQVISEAQKPQYQNTVTPELVRKVFLRLLDEQGEFKPKDNETRLEWIRLMDEVEKAFIIPRFEADILAAIGHGGGSVQRTYEEVFYELAAISRDPSTREYQGPSGETRKINFERLKAIEAKYAEIHQDHLPVQEIMSFAAITGADKPHLQLVQAIERFFAEKVMEFVSWSDFVTHIRGGEGSQEVKGYARDLMSALVHQYGYNEFAAKVAFEMVHARRTEEKEKAAQAHEQ